MLVVLDDTPAVAGVASTIPSKLAQYPDLLAKLFPGGQPPLHAAFIPGTVPSGGCAPPPNRAASCGVPEPDQFLASKFCGIDPDFTGSASDAFSCLADYGASDCGTFQPLEAVHRALAARADGGLTGQVPFFTPGAALAVVIVAGQDDASSPGGMLKPVDDYLAELTRLAPLSFVPVVVGPSGCPDGGPVAPVDLPRLAAFVNGGAGVMQSICDTSFKQWLTTVAAASTAFEEGVTLCLKGIKDMDPGQPGLQASCTVQDDVTEADGRHVSSLLPVCDAAESVRPCLSLTPDPGPLRQGCWVPRIVRPADPVASCGPQAMADQVSCVACTDSSSPGCAPSP